MSARGLVDPNTRRPPWTKLETNCNVTRNSYGFFAVFRVVFNASSANAVQAKRIITNTMATGVCSVIFASL